MPKGLRLTIEQVRQHQERNGFVSFVSTGQSAVSAVLKLAGKSRGAKQPNKTESEFSRILIARFNSKPRFEAVKLRIGGNCYYSPDYMIVQHNGRPTFYECKGAHIWDDSRVKFKAAKEMHDWADFEMWQKKQGQWARIL